MQKLFENFRSFMNEGVMDDKPYLSDKNAKAKFNSNNIYTEEEAEQPKSDEIESAVLDTLEKEGGAAGFKPLFDAAKEIDPEITEEQVKEILSALSNVKQHKDEDYIEVSGLELEEAVNIFLEAKEEMLDEKRKKKKKRDACYHKVKARYKVWPSAYASGALVKCRKKGAKNWGTGGKKKKKNESLENKSESLALENKNAYSYTKDGVTYTFTPNTKRKMTDEEYAKSAEEFAYEQYLQDVRDGIIKPEPTKSQPVRGVKIQPGERGREKTKRKKTYVHDPTSTKLGNKVYGTKNNPNVIPKFAHQDREVHIKPELKNEDLTLEEIILEELENVLSEKCWPGYEKRGMKTMFGKRYPNCVKKTKKKGKRRKKRKNEEIEEQYEIAEEVEEDLKKWFSQNKGKGWVDCKTGKPCGRQKGEKRKGYPACRPTMAQCTEKGKRAKKSSKEVEWE